MNSNRPGGLLMKIQLLKLLFFKRVSLCLPLPQRFQNTFKALKTLKPLSFKRNKFRELKQRQLKIRFKTDISLKITLNVFKCLIVFLVPLKFLYTLAAALVLFQLVPSLSVNLLWCQSVHFTVSPGRKGTFFFQHIQLHNR